MTQPVDVPPSSPEYAARLGRRRSDPPATAEPLAEVVTDRRFQPGGTWVLDVPDGVPAVWGEADKLRKVKR